MTGAAAAGRWASTWTPTQYARNGTVEIAYDKLAGPEGDPLLLVMGLAVSRFWWPAGLCQAFADRGFAVARYDQRDAGQSTRMPDTGGSNPFVALARKRGAYSSEDMTDDAIAVLDALGWERAHIFGASLGGIIAQRIALRHPGPGPQRHLGHGHPQRRGRDQGGPVRALRPAGQARPDQVPGRPRGRHPALAHARPRTRLPGLPVRRGRPPGSGSSARSTAVPGTPKRRAGRSAPRGTAPSSATCTSPSWSCTATGTPSCGSAPPAPPPGPSTAPAW